jgi:tight adherence protein C
MLTVAVAISVFATVFVLVMGIVQRPDPARARLEMVHRGARPEPVEETGPSFSERLISPLTTWVVHRVSTLLPASWLDGLRRHLIMAGEPTTVSGFLMVEVISTLAVTMLAVVMVSVSTSSIGLLHVAGVIVAGLVGLLFPQLWLRQRLGQRQAHIIKSLPDAFDLITTCVEAGLGLDAALARVSEKVEGPFAEELSRTLREVSLGKMRRDALRELGERTGVQDLITFVNAVIQAEEMGSSIGTVLRVQSEQLRIRRRQRAEEQAHKAPVKMIFPLVLCIFPTLFLVILGPAVITIMDSFGG